MEQFVVVVVVVVVIGDGVVVGDGGGFVFEVEGGNLLKKCLCSNFAHLIEVVQKGTTSSEIDFLSSSYKPN